MSMNVSLTKKLEEFVVGKVQSGGYSSASEVVREGLRLLQETEQRKRFSFSNINELEDKLLSGVEQLNRGEGIPADRVKKQLQTHSRKQRKLRHG
jgi:antitoxin ParD1/3/4